MPRGELILYPTEDGRTEIQLRAEEGTVWLTQGQMAELFDTTKQNVSLHMRNVLAEGEVSQSVVKQSLIPASDGKRYRTKIYNLDAILAVGYRVRSPRGVQFRWQAPSYIGPRTLGTVLMVLVEGKKGGQRGGEQDEDADGSAIITIAAISLGAPFCFDLLGKVANLRGSGDRIEDQKQARNEPRRDTRSAEEEAG